MAGSGKGKNLVGWAIIVGAAAFTFEAATDTGTHQASTKSHHSQPSGGQAETHTSVLNVNNPNCTQSGEYPNDEAHGWVLGSLELAGFQYAEALDWVKGHGDAVSAVSNAAEITINCV